ncbi:ABC transporter ATP-binding protein [Achromobacter marplatensis]|uniref:ABC transporter ATP-binding protein n=1 Tax=Achromobacter marplatensis TaxID=470868 RepID=UPI0028EBF707|nr:ABC transporter ATP-binding protein [Achromobacter marplatensis]
MSEAHLSLRGVCKSFVTPDGDRHGVLRDLSLDITPGEFVCILGASGSGKTTLIRALAGLESIDQGEIRHGGRRPGAGFVFQRDALLPWRTVLENVVFGLEMQGMPRAEREVRGRELLALVGLAHVGKHYPSALSGGMRQRVNLARALAVDRDLLLMDEPFSALDAQTREIMQRELLAIWAQHRKTVLFITHQIDEAIYLADRIIVLGSAGQGIRADLRVDDPRPRDLALKRAPHFIALAEHLWSLLEADVVAAIHQERQA